MNPNDPIQPGVWRIIDTCCNRATEGLRTIEEYTRFILDDAFLTAELKQLRHDLTAAVNQFDRRKRLSSRDTTHDVGTMISTPAESQRSGALEVAVAAAARCEQSLRCLEEYGKVIDGETVRQIETCRYRAYTLFAAVEQISQRRERLANCTLQVLVGGGDSTEAMVSVMAEIADAGADIIQLRDKNLEDRGLLERASAAVMALRSSPCLLIVNDRPDIAAAAGADGVHVGQEELPVSAARRIVGSEAIVGVSTHSIEQARQAVLDGADYIGCGPTFASLTKDFAEFPGLTFLAAIAAEIRLPAFAIGGIDLHNVNDVTATGIRAVAVSSAVTARNPPGAAVRDLKQALKP